MGMSGRLYLLPASLGESPWAATLPPQVRDIACRLDYFIVENAKSARAELKRLGYPRPLREAEIVELPKEGSVTDWRRLLDPVAAGRDGGLMSEAGCPAIADPGALLVRAAHDSGIRAIPLVGPSSILLALMASGLNGQSFAFHGYLPVRDAERQARIVALEKESHREGRTQIFIETPYRNAQLLAALLAACQSETLISVAAGLTTAEEWIATRTVADWRRSEVPPIAKKPTLFLILSP